MTLVDWRRITTTADRIPLRRHVGVLFGDAQDGRGKRWALT
jgi:hypothetical protein